MSRGWVVMAVFRVEKNHSYTVMANHHLRDERLSLKSKGLLSLILSLPDDWRISIEGMTQFSADGKDTIRSAIRELTDAEIAAYIKTKEPMDKAGAYGIQGYGSMFVSHLDGDYFCVMGLPVCTLAGMLRSAGVEILGQI